MISMKVGGTMSRQRAGWGLSRFLENFSRANRPRSETAGINKYDPQTATRELEAKRRLKQLQQRAEKRKNERDIV